MSTLLVIRPMRHADLTSILEIQAMCYTELIPESEDSLKAKLSASPSTCYVACQLDSVIGYLISSPGLFESPPELDAATFSLPPNPDSLYLHDVAVAPHARRSGAGRALVEKFIVQSRDMNFRHASLIAVQNSKSYWQRYGFRPVRQTSALKAKLSSYGDNVEYMERIA
jgi:ribosomal protein S18 acetylase RimI-like enzyme